MSFEQGKSPERGSESRSAGRSLVSSAHMEEYHAVNPATKDPHLAVGHDGSLSFGSPFKTANSSTIGDASGAKSASAHDGGVNHYYWSDSPPNDGGAKGATPNDGGAKGATPNDGGANHYYWTDSPPNDGGAKSPTPNKGGANHYYWPDGSESD